MSIKYFVIAWYVVLSVSIDKHQMYLTLPRNLASSWWLSASVYYSNSHCKLATFSKPDPGCWQQQLHIYMPADTLHWAVSDGYMSTDQPDDQIQVVRYWCTELQNLVNTITFMTIENRNPGNDNDPKMSDTTISITAMFGDTIQI